MEIVIGTYDHCLLGIKVDKLETIKPELSLSFTLKQQTGTIRTIACSNKQHWLVSGGDEEQLHLINLKTRKEYGSLLGHSGTITDLKFLTDGSLVSCSGDGTIIFWKYGKVNGSKKALWEKYDSISNTKNDMKKVHKDEPYKEKTSYKTMAIHSSENLAICGDATFKTLNILDFTEKSVVAEKKLRGKGKKNPLDRPDQIEFSGDDFYIFTEPNILRKRDLTGIEKWKVSLSMTKVNGFLVLENRVLVYGQNLGAEDGKRTRKSAFQFLDAETGEEAELQEFHSNLFL